MTPEIYAGSPPYVREAFCRQVPPSQYVPIHPVVKVICQCSGYSFQELCGRGRDAEIVVARQAAMYYLTTRCGMSLTEVGKLLKHDHATVYYAKKQYPVRVATAGYEAYAELDAKIRSLLK